MNVIIIISEQINGRDLRAIEEKAERGKEEESSCERYSLAALN